MISGVPIFRGRDNNDQLNQIIRVLGTPDDRTMRKIMQDSVSHFKLWTSCLPGLILGYPNVQPEVQARALHRYPKQDLHGLIPRAPQEAIDLLEGLLEFEPSQRLTAHEALRHPYFATNTASPAVGSNGASSSQQQQQQQAMLHQQAVIRQQQEQVSFVRYISGVRTWLIRLCLGNSTADAATERATAVPAASAGCPAV